MIFDWKSQILALLGGFTLVFLLVGLGINYWVSWTVGFIDGLFILFYFHRKYKDKEEK